MGVGGGGRGKGKIFCNLMEWSQFPNSFGAGRFICFVRHTGVRSPLFYRYLKNVSASRD